MKIRTKRLSGKSLFKLLFIGISVPMAIFIIICGIASLFGAHTVRWNYEPVTGAMGLVASLMMAPFFCIFFAGLMWIFFELGLWVYSWFRTIELELVEPAHPFESPVNSDKATANFTVNSR